MYCIECGKEIQAIQKHCNHCGFSQENLINDQQLMEAKKRSITDFDIHTFKISWNQWDEYSKTIFVSTICAFVSMLFPWISLGPMDINGFQRGHFLILVLWIYPAYCLLKNQDINKNQGYFISVLSVMWASYSMFFSEAADHPWINTKGIGAIIFTVASITLAAGISKYKRLNID